MQSHRQKTKITTEPYRVYKPEEPKMFMPVFEPARGYVGSSLDDYLSPRIRSVEVKYLTLNDDGTVSLHGDNK